MLCLDYLLNVIKHAVNERFGEYPTREFKDKAESGLTSSIFIPYRTGGTVGLKV